MFHWLLKYQDENSLIFYVWSKIKLNVWYSWQHIYIIIIIELYQIRWLELISWWHIKSLITCAKSYCTFHCTSVFIIICIKPLDLYWFHPHCSLNHLTFIGSTLIATLNNLTFIGSTLITTLNYLTFIGSTLMAIFKHLIYNCY